MLLVHHAFGSQAHVTFIAGVIHDLFLLFFHATYSRISARTETMPRAGTAMVILRPVALHDDLDTGRSSKSISATFAHGARSLPMDSMCAITFRFVGLNSRKIKASPSSAFLIALSTTISGDTRTN